MADNQNQDLVSELRAAQAHAQTQPPSADFIKLLTLWKSTSANNQALPKPDIAQIFGLVEFDETLCYKEKVILPNIFLVRSVLIVSMHLTLAYYSRKLNCNPDIPSVLDAGDETVKKDINDRKKACSIELDDESL